MNKNPKYPAAAVPYLMVRDAAAAFDFYKKAFGAEEMMRFPGPNGKIMHGEVRIEGAPVFLADASDEPGMQGPDRLGGTPVGVCLYVADVDAFAKRAEAAGATVVRPLADQFYGERSVSFSDPFGHVWHIATVVEELSVDELKKRMPQ